MVDKSFGTKWRFSLNKTKILPYKSKILPYKSKILPYKTKILPYKSKISWPFSATVAYIDYIF